MKFQLNYQLLPVCANLTQYFIQYVKIALLCMICYNNDAMRITLLLFGLTAFARCINFTKNSLIGVVNEKE